MDRTLAYAVRAGSAARVASAAIRRRQIALLRTALLMHKAQNKHHRRQVSVALARLRGSCAEFRRRVRRDLGALATRAAARVHR